MPFSDKQNTNLKEFRHIVGDASRGYWFEISIPILGAGNLSADTKTITCLARSTTLPKSSIEDVPFEFQKSTFHMGGRAKFDAWNITFLVDSYHKLRHRLLAWQNLIFDPSNQTGFVPSSYKNNDVMVKQLDRMGIVVTGYKFKGLYPAEVGEIALDQGSSDMETFTVSFIYDYYVMEGAGNITKAADLQDAQNLKVGEEVLSKITAVKTSDSYDVTDIDVNGKDGYQPEKVSGSNTTSKTVTGATVNNNQNVQSSHGIANLFGSRSPIGYNPIVTAPASTPASKDDIAQKEIDLSGKAVTQPAALGFFAAIGNSISPSNQPYGSGRINTPDSSNRDTGLALILDFNPYNAFGVPYSYRWMPPVKGLASIRVSRKGLAS